MRGRTVMSIIGLAAGATLALALLLVTGGTAGEWHTGTTNLCSDCHTMHFSQSHNWDGSTPVSADAQQNGNWLSASGPNNFLLKAPANQLCLACHGGQTFAPDVFEDNTNAAGQTEGRQAGALNEAGASPYETWKGHSLGSTATPPGWNPAAVGASTTWYNAANGLECISCHAQHGPAGAYRNLGPYALGGAAANARPSYVISNTNDTTKDVWISLASYTANSGTAATFAPYYDRSKVSFNRNDALVGTTNTSNKIDTFCGACHGNFHGAPGDSTVGAAVNSQDGFLRHPTSKAVIGYAGSAAGGAYGGHSSLTRFVANTTKVKVYASDTTAYTDASPGCVSCHKGHGNKNPFGLIFLNRAATAVSEEGGYASGQTQDLQQGYRNLCGQCHGQGN